MYLRKFRLLNLLHPCTFFLVYYLFFLGIGCLLLLVATRYYDYSISTRTYQAVGLYLGSFVLGTMTAPILALRRPQPLAPLEECPLHRWKTLGLLFWLLGNISLMIFYLKAGSIPLFAGNIEVARVELKVGIGKYIILGRAFLTVGLSALHILCIFKKVAKQFKWFVYVITVEGMVMLAGIGFRSPVAYLLLTVVLTHIFISESYISRQKIPLKIVVFGLVMVGFLAILGYLRYRGEFKLASIVFLWPMLVYALALDRIVNYFPVSHPYLYGSSFITDILAVVPGVKSEFLGNWLKSLIQLTFKGGGIAVTAPGEAYINFGFYGVFFLGLLLGCLGGLIYELYSQRSRVADRWILILLSINFARCVTSGIMPALFFSFLPQVILAYCFIWLSRVK